MSKRVLGIASVLLAVVITAGCGADPDMPATHGGQSGVKVAVTTLDNVFGHDGADVRVPVGATVDWTNDGHNDHQITAVNGPKGFGVAEQAFTPGKSYSYRFTKPGVYRYFCALHGNKHGGMIGRIVVGGVKAPPIAAAVGSNAPAKASGRTIRVPADQPTIQKAVDAAGPGDLILVSPGTYHGEVDVPASKPYLTIRGLDRNKTILDGQFKAVNGIEVVKAKGVSVENLTLENFAKNGVFWTGVTGYRGSYLTAIRNGDYGIYSFQSTKGQLDHSFSQGSPDAGFYIGGCEQCDALMVDDTSQWNGLGYSGTNSSGNLVIARSIFRDNRAGIVPNSGSYEPFAPEHGNTLVGNLVEDNNNGKTAAIDIAVTAMGNGILIAGGSGNTIERNRVVDHTLGGIVVITYPESADYVWVAKNNVVKDNVVSKSGLGDLAFWYNEKNQGTGNNCFADNTFTSSAPHKLEELLPCTGKGHGDESAGAFDVVQLAVSTGKPPSVPYQKVVLPAVPDQPQMPGASSTKGDPAINVPEKLDLSTIGVPAAPN